MFGPEGLDPTPGPGDRWEGREPTATEDPDRYCPSCLEPLYLLAGHYWEWGGASFVYHLCPDND